MLPINIARELFRWESHSEWVNRAARDFRRARAGGELPHSGEYICVDSAGTVCEIGRDFAGAVFPVVVYLLAKVGVK